MTPSDVYAGTREACGIVWEIMGHSRRRSDRVQAFLEDGDASPARRRRQPDFFQHAGRRLLATRCREGKTESAGRHPERRQHARKGDELTLVSLRWQRSHASVWFAVVTADGDVAHPEITQ